MENQENQKPGRPISLIIVSWFLILSSTTVLVLFSRALALEPELIDTDMFVQAIIVAAYLVIGFGLFFGQNWARVLIIIASFVGVAWLGFTIPNMAGTLILFYLLFLPKTNKYFARNKTPASPATITEHQRGF